MKQKYLFIALFTSLLGSSVDSLANSGLSISAGGLYSLPSGTGYGFALGAPTAALALNLGGGKVLFHLESGFNMRNAPTGAVAATFSAIYGFLGTKIYLGNVFYLTLGGFYEYLLRGSLALTRTSDYGAAGGFGVLIKGRFFIESRYYLALATVAANNLRPSYATVSIGFRFGGKK